MPYISAPALVLVATPCGKNQTSIPVSNCYKTFIAKVDSSDQIKILGHCEQRGRERMCVDLMKGSILYFKTYSLVFTTERKSLANAKHPDDFIKYMGRWHISYLPRRKVVWEFCLTEFASRMLLLCLPWFAGSTGALPLTLAPRAGSTAWQCTVTFNTKPLCLVGCTTVIGKSAFENVIYGKQNIDTTFFTPL